MRITRFEFTQLHDFRPKANQFSFEELAEEMSQEEIKLPEKPSFTEEQLEEARVAARKQAYNEGFEAGSATANKQAQDLEKDVRTALESLAGRISDAHAGYDAVLASQSRDINQFVLAIARKVAGEALSNRPDLAIQELIDHCLPILVQKPRLTVEANGTLIAILQDRLKTTLERAGFDGDILFRTNDALDASDTRLEWNGGVAERNTATLWKEIEEMLAHVSFFPDKTDHSPRAQNKE